MIWNERDNFHLPELVESDTVLREYDEYEFVPLVPKFPVSEQRLLAKSQFGDQCGDLDSTVVADPNCCGCYCYCCCCCDCTRNRNWNWICSFCCYIFDWYCVVRIVVRIVVAVAVVDDLMLMLLLECCCWCCCHHHMEEYGPIPRPQRQSRGPATTGRVETTNPFE